MMRATVFIALIALASVTAAAVVPVTWNSAVDGDAAAVNIEPNDNVTWTITGAETVTADTGVDARTAATGAAQWGFLSADGPLTSYTHKFRQPGLYPYFSEATPQLNSTVCVFGSGPCDRTAQACGTPMTGTDSVCGETCPMNNGTMCAVGSTCTDNVCVCDTPCPDTDLTTCGDTVTDACGNDCATGTQCSTNFTCTLGTCECDLAACALASTVACGSPLGVDGCGQSCPGTGSMCTGGATCTADVCVCPTPCTDPATVACGSAIPDACGASCAAGTMCPVTQTCTLGACVNVTDDSSECESDCTDLAELPGAPCGADLSNITDSCGNLCADTIGRYCAPNDEGITCANRPTLGSTCRNPNYVNTGFGPFDSIDQALADLFEGTPFEDPFARWCLISGIFALIIVIGVVLCCCCCPCCKKSKDKYDSDDYELSGL